MMDGIGDDCHSGVLETYNNGMSSGVEMKIASPLQVTMNAQESALILRGEEKEVLATAFNMCAGEKECTNERVNNEENDNIVERTIASPLPMMMNDQESALIHSGEKKEVLAKAFTMGAEEKECPNEGVNGEENDGSKSAEMTIASPRPVMITGKESSLILSGGIKEVTAKTFNKECSNDGVREEENGIEVADREDIKEKIKIKKQLKANSRKIPNNSRKTGKGVIAKKRAPIMTKMMAKRKNDQEPSIKRVAYGGEDDNELMKQGACNEEKADKGMTSKEDKDLSNVIVRCAEPKEEVNMNKKAGGEMTKDENMKEEVKNRDLVKVMPKNNVKSRKARLGRKKQGASTGMAVVVPKNTREQESSDKKMEKKAKYAGMIFMCSSKTKKDCYTYKVLGLPASKRDLVLTVFEGMKLFLFDVDLKLLYGVYKAAGPGGYNIEPKAFKSAFPSQVRFSVHEDCLPIPEEKFKSAIKDNYYQKNKFSSELTSEQVNNLCKLFQAASKSSKSKRFQKSITLEHQKAADRERIRKWRQGRAENTFVDRERSRKRFREVQRSEYVDRDRSRKQRREVKKSAYVDRDRSRKQQRGIERSEHVDQDRSRKRPREHERYPDYGRDGVYRDGMDAHERRVYASPIAPLSLNPPLPATSVPALPLSYSYDRSLEMNVSRRPPIINQRDRPFLNLDLRPHEHIDYRRDRPNDHRERWFQDSESDAHFQHKNRPTYYDQMHYAAQPSAYYHAGGTSRDTTALSREYRPLRSIYRY